MKKNHISNYFYVKSIINDKNMILMKINDMWW